MKGGHTIRRIIALFLACVFTLGITPRKTLHNLLANHKDKNTKQADNKTQHLSTAGFNCKCDDLVAESNFITAAGFAIIAPASFPYIFSSYYRSFISLPHLFFDLRGPPMKF